MERKKHHKDICRRCKASCCKMGGADFTSEERKAILKAGHIDHSRKIGKDHYEMRSKRGICPYLAKDHRCSIYDVRPDMCRCWPVFAEYDKDGRRKYIILECPLTGRLDTGSILDMKRTAESIPSYLLRYHSTRSKLPKKDIDMIMKRYNRYKMSDCTLI